MRDVHLVLFWPPKVTETAGRSGTCCGRLVFQPDLHDTVVLDQDVLANNWASLGSFAFDAGDATVVLTRGALRPDDGTIADQIKFVSLTEEVLADNSDANFQTTGSTSTSLAPGEYVVLVRNEEAFDRRYDIAGNGIVVAGEYSGKLDNNGEKVRLFRAGNPGPTGYIPYHRVDHVNYGDEPPWPVEPDGSGNSLSRLRGNPDELYGNDSASWAAGVYLGTPGVENVFLRARVVGRYIFYNNSYFDGFNAAPGVNDDGAIAPDPGTASDPGLGKKALLPGQTATMANYTSFSSGINGIMVDIRNLADAGGVSAADFEFHVGNTHDPSTWGTAPAPTSVTVHEGGGAGDSDRVTLLWTDGDIQKQWLKVTVKANATTGLDVADVFYFGNAVGESLDSPSLTFVDGTDFAGARDNAHDSDDRAPIDDRFDYNRDSLVDTADLAIARDNHTNHLTCLTLFTVPPLGGSVSSSLSNSSSSPTVQLSEVPSLADCELGASVAISGSDWPAHCLVDRSYLPPRTRQPTDEAQQSTEDFDPQTVFAIFQNLETNGSESASDSALRTTGDRWLNAVDGLFLNEDGDLLTW